MTSHVNPDQSMGFAVRRLQLTLRSRMDAALAGYGLTSPQYAVLALLAEHPGISNAELARRCFVAPPTMLRVLDGLDRAGLIDRAALTPDQRARGTVLSRQGQRRLAKATAHVQEFEDLLAANADPEHIDIIMTWLRTCVDELNRQPD